MVEWKESVWLCDESETYMEDNAYENFIQAVLVEDTKNLLDEK